VLNKTVDLKDAIEEMQKQYGYSARQILEAAKKLYKEHSEGTKDSHIPRVRTSSEFRRQTEVAAAKVEKTITEYIYDAVEDSNKKLEEIG
jgi:predicted HicB family RNase H-like nuclease